MQSRETRTVHQSSAFFKTVFVLALASMLCITMLFQAVFSYPISSQGTWTYEGSWKIADGVHFEKNDTGIARAIYTDASVSLGKLDYMLHVNFPAFSGSDLYVVETFGTKLEVSMYFYENLGFVGINIRFNGENIVVMPTDFTTLTGVNLELSVFNNSGSTIARITIYWGPTKIEHEFSYNDFGTVSYNRTIRMSGPGVCTFSDMVFDDTGGSVEYFDSKPDWIGQVIQTITGIYSAVVFVYNWIYNATIFVANTLYFFWNFTTEVLIPVLLYVFENIYAVGVALVTIFFAWRYVIPFSSIAMFKSKDEFYDRMQMMFDRIRDDVTFVLDFLASLIPL